MTDPVRERDRSGRRDDLRDAAIRVFCEKGFAAASIGDVAAEMGVLKGSIYHYISSKDELLEWVFDAGREASQSRMDAEVPEGTTAVERLRSFLASMTTWYLEHVEHATVLFREFRYLEGERRRPVARHRREYEEFVRGLISAAIDESGAPGTRDPESALRLVLGALQASPEWYRRSGKDAPAHVAAVYTELSLRALGVTR